MVSGSSGSLKNTALISVSITVPNFVISTSAKCSGDPPLAVLLTTSGGLVGGDEIRISVTARAGAVAGVTTQAAEKVYRTLGPAASPECSRS